MQERAAQRALIEACHRAPTSAGAWCHAVADAARRALPFVHGVGLVLNAHEATRLRPLVAAVDSLPEPFRKEASAMQDLDPVADRAILSPNTKIALASTVTSQVSPEIAARMQEAMRASDTLELVGVVGHPAPDWSFTLGLPLKPGETMTPRRRMLLERLRLHIEVGLCSVLRARPPVAIVDPDGQLLALDGENEHAPAKLAWRQHVRKIERMRRPRLRAADADDALHAWSAVVAGRWSMVERCDDDGRRYYQIFEVAREARASRALSDEERALLELYLAGASTKEVAARLQRGSSTASERLARIADKLGLRSRSELLRLGARLHDAALPPDVRLTDSERDVLHGVGAGATDAGIAQARGTSVHTVRKQVASLRTKLGARSRSALAAFASDR